MEGFGQVNAKSVYIRLIVFQFNIETNFCLRVDTSSCACVEHILHLIYDLLQSQNIKLVVEVWRTSRRISLLSFQNPELSQSKIGDIELSIISFLRIKGPLVSVLCYISAFVKILIVLSNQLAILGDL